VTIDRLAMRKDASGMIDQQTIVARFQITGWEETDLPNLPNETASGAKMTKQFTDAIAGSSEGLIITSGIDEGSRAYVAVERVKPAPCRMAARGRSRSTNGGLSRRRKTWFGHIVPGTGTADLTGNAAPREHRSRRDRGVLHHRARAIAGVAARSLHRIRRLRERFVRGTPSRR